MELKKLMEHISIIPDYRQAWKVEYKLSDILLLTICAVISDAEGWEDIEDFGETHLDFLKQYGDFENGIPVHDTIARVVSSEHDSYAISEKSHGREEIRLHIVCDVPDELIDFTFEWKGLKKLCVAVSFRSIIAEQKKEPEMTVRYYISSADLTAEKFATAIRNHWHVENKLHWRLDVVMNEDDCRIRRGNAAELFSGIRHIAINILTNDKVFKAGLRRKMRKAAMDRNYLASVLAGSGLS
ncbi:ISAs1 family transposase [Escherichia coli]|uniref:ISAs1 family transposase n=2 Tax=Escherichia coli TaxID=562 RepID=UPI001C70A892|nr:ISAs1 family transposase [Escherichia coli]MBW9586248.1 ISAs1 family transposase [Escherichia coli]